MKLHIITRCTRPKNLEKIKKSILVITGYEIKWHIIFDTNLVKEIQGELLSNLDKLDINIQYNFMPSSKKSYGYDSVNKVISNINDDEWIYLLDDDNILHPNFNELIPEITNDINILVFNQYIGGKDFTGLEFREAKVENTKVGGVDAAQYIIRAKMIKSNNYKSDYCADGILMESLIKDHLNEFKFINKVYCFYNSLKEERKKFSLPRILTIGLDKEIELKSKHYHYEASELNVRNIPNDYNIDNVIKEFNPDAIVTLGKDYNKFNNLPTKSVDVRKRWIHCDDLGDNPTENIGESAYYCANSYILTGNKDDANPLVSFFTPIYNTGDKLYRTFNSLKNQTYSNWEWVLVNDSNDNGLTLNIAEDIAKNDCRVKVYDFKEKTGGIVGESKYRAAMLSKGKYLMELDHDDYLVENATELMVKAFKEYPDCKFVYSDCAEIYENHTCIKYGDGFSFGYGTYREEEYNGRIYDVANTSNINPKTIRHIVGVPNHFRAWDAVFYRTIGGHNRRLTIADDYELIVRTFLKTKMVRIPKLLYLQYYHDSNTQNLTRADIQRRVKSIRFHYNEDIHNRFIELGVKDWAYDFNNYDPLCADSKFGDDENYVNYIMDLSTIEVPIIKPLEYII
jgi:glycosyltransferase involved in cell wall biosynthesis